MIHPSAFVASLCVCVCTALAHPVNIYGATLTIEGDRAVLGLVVDDHGLAHERLLFADDPSDDDIRTNLVRSIRIRDADDNLLRPDSIETRGDHAVAVYTLDNPGACSISQEPIGALAIGRRVIAVTLIRPGTDTQPRTVELSSGANPEIISLTAHPIPDPERFTRPRIRVRAASELVIDFPVRILPRDARDDPRAYRHWIHDHLDATIRTIETTYIDTHDTAITPDELNAHNPAMIRARAVVHLDQPIESLTWTGFSTSLRACDVLDAQGNRITTLNPSANTSTLVPPNDD